MSKQSNTIPTNRYNDKYTSLIRSIKIFLPPRQKHGNEDDGKDDDFVGRERLMERLFLWLSDKDNKMGSYLVTGFRGMGKTSLVDRTIRRLIREIDSTTELWAKVSLMLIIVAFGLFLVGFEKLADNKCCLWVGFVCTAIALFVFVASCICNNPKNEIKKLRKKIPNRKDFLQLLVDRLARGKRLDFSQKEFSNIKISVNLGHEVLKERDILGLIATNVRDKYKDYLNSIQPRWFIVLMTTLSICAVSGALTYITKYTVHEAAIFKNGKYEYLNLLELFIMFLLYWLIMVHYLLTYLMF